ncbi:uncharacterized protein TRAVEDRAFT_52748 [Trametes versicolor FP-101664 SS1]|uniref:uncharacterized protein n=1 Tax=Trametes versicolor (strain FP-101664) TaxID=717944 RepID=UPI0004623754|nr:uncharacterized protein TRAVEDRAFT_52748 [Trametes versicolor FP-101664 SS1]EIW53628.1 hypothetical protein TRAVEDRAFT_52748 [Trametes versicolor FP-101664 SS1]
MAAAAAPDVPEFHTHGGEYVQLPGEADFGPAEYLTWYIESLLGRIAYLQSELARREEREEKLQELLHASELINEEYKMLYLRARQLALHAVNEADVARHGCVCLGGAHGPLEI